MSLTDSSFILKNDGTLWSCGRNNYGPLGLGDTIDRSIFTQVNISNVKQVSCGGNFTFIVKNDGTLWACGHNGLGQLGLNDTVNRSTFTQVNISDVKQISCGSYHTVLLKNDGTLWSCGYNSHGQLGLNDTTDRYTFTQVNIDDAEFVLCGYNHTFVLKTDGTVWSCGYNNSGQLGLNDTTTRKTFTQVNMSDVKQISCGGYHTFILKNDSTLWVCGLNNYGQLGLGDAFTRISFTQVDINNVELISCNRYGTLALKHDGTVWATGLNNTGQLGLGDIINTSTFTELDITDVYEISHGYDHTLILRGDGTLWSCGLNSHGQLGLGNVTYRMTFEQVDIYDINRINDSAIVYTEEPKYELINIMDVSNIISSGNKYLITLPYRCKVFKYTLSTDTSVYYTMDNTLSIDSDISEWTFDRKYIATMLRDTKIKNVYVCRQLLIETNNIKDFKIWAEYDDGHINIGRISSEKLSKLTPDVKNNLYITEDKYVYINDIHGNYHKLIGAHYDLLFHGDIISAGSNIVDNLSKYHTLLLISKDADNNYYNDTIYMDSEFQTLKIINNNNSVTINITDDIITFSDVNGLIITLIYGLR